MVALATMMTSCLTEDPRDQLYEEDIYNNANNIYIRDCRKKNKNFITN